MVKLIVNRKAYLPVEHANFAVLNKHYFHRMYDDAKCSRCPIAGDRHALECENCSGYRGDLQLWEQKTVKGKEYIALPPGNLDKIGVLMKKKLKIDDRRPIVKMRDKIKFTGKLFEGQVIKGRKTVNQKALVEAWSEKKSGMIEAPARSGKCIVGSSWIMTEKGLHPIKDLFEGLKLPQSEFECLHNSGIATVKGQKTTAGLYSKIVDRTIKIDLGWTSIEGTPNHPIKIANRFGRIKWKPLSEISDKDMVVCSRKSVWLGNHIVLPKIKIEKNIHDTNSIDFQFPKKVTVELARLLGYLVANGRLSIKNKIGFSSMNDQIRKDYIRCLTACFPEVPYKEHFGENKCPGVSFHSIMIKKWITRISGFPYQPKSADKFIPDFIKCAPEHTAKEFLAAYLVCDSSWRDNNLTICSASKKLINEMIPFINYLTGAIPFKKRSFLARAHNGSGIKRRYNSIRYTGTESKRIFESLGMEKVFKNSAYNYQDNIPGIINCIYKLQQRNFKNHAWFIDEKKTTSPIRVDFSVSKNRYAIISRSRNLKIDWNKIKLMDYRIYRRLQNLYNPNFYFSPIKSITVNNKPKRVYDVYVPKGNQFIANGIVNHNTVTAVNIVCQEGVRTLIVAHQADFLRQFLRTFVGNKETGHKAMTNVPELRKKTGREIVGIVKKPEDLKKYDVALITYQSFIRKETARKRILKYIKNRFSLVVVDEVHRGAADAFSKFLAQLNCRYRLSLSATIDRKDGRSIVLPEYMGPVVAKAQSTALVPLIKLVETGVSTSYNYGTWVYAMKFLASNKQRTQLILNEIFKDYKKGHKCIIIPVDYKNQAFALKNLINEEAEKRGYKSAFSDVFHAGCNRVKILEDVDKGKIPVLISIRSMMTMGIDLSLPSMIYIVTPMSGNSTAGAPMFYQLAYRVATWMENKKTPTVKVFIDGIVQSSGCFKSLFWKEIYPKLEGRNKQPKYRMLESDYKRAIQVAGARKYVPVNSAGERLTSKKILERSGEPDKRQMSRVNMKRAF